MSFEMQVNAIITHAEPDDTGALRQWAIISVSVPKDFDFKANGAAVLKKLQAAADLIGRGE